MSLRRVVLGMRSIAFAAALLFAAHAAAQSDPLPSWNEGAAKQAIVDFVQATTAEGGPRFVPPAERIAAFDQLLNDNNAGKPEGIHLMIGRRPLAAFGNSTGDREMLAYTAAGSGARLAMLVLHDDATREYAYGPARGLRDTKVGAVTQALAN